MSPMPQFDPEGTGFDTKTFQERGLKRDATGHGQSRLPFSAQESASLGLPPNSGLILKGRKHPTFHLTIKGEEQAGFRIITVPSGPLKGRLISVPKTTADFMREKRKK